MSTSVLVLDDNADNRQLLFFALRAGGYTIHQAELGAEAIELINNTRFDVALVDVELPDGNGLDLAPLLFQRNPELCLVILSANDDVERLARARTIGAHAYVIKPYNLPQVLSFIRDYEHQGCACCTEMQVL